ncbi:MAG: regulatory protein RecX [Bacteroidota bacterium]
MDNSSNIDNAGVIAKIARYCAFQERCRQEVLQKLKEWKVPPEQTDRITGYLEGNNFLNELRFARSFARGKFRSNKWGRIRIQYELKSRQIPGAFIREAMQEISEEEYRATLRQLILKKQLEIKAGKNLNIREKIINFVSGKGFEPDLAAEVLKELKI